MTLGPCLLSGETIRRANEKTAAAYKGHKLIAIPVGLVIVLFIPSIVQTPSLTRTVTLLGPLTVVFLGAVFLKPYRLLHRLECHYTITDDQIVAEYWIDGKKKPTRSAARWCDVVGATDELDGITLHLRSGQKLLVYEECLRSPRDREELLAHVQANQAR